VKHSSPWIETSCDTIMQKLKKAFTLVELLVAVSVLALLILFIAGLFNAITNAITTSGKHIDTDAQARPVLDRLAIDLAQIVKRTEVDYYFKSPSSPQAGNDQIAFFSQVSGYYPTTGSQSPFSLVAYRVNSDSSSQAFNKVERLAKGLLWNGESGSSVSIVFLPLNIAATWPQATNSAADPQADYEIVGPQVFRFEYYYLLKNGGFSDTPWDAAAGHVGSSGTQDLAAIVVTIATIDKKSRVLVTDGQLTSLAASMADYSGAMRPGDLCAQWRSAIDQNNAAPRVALSGIRIYERHFHLP
jgi:prepilin-type N-terminal cleavage/methylation domain-containing protein